MELRDTDRWQASVERRLLAESRAIVPLGEAFGADLRSLGRTAILDEEGLALTLRGQPEPLLQLRTVGFGREQGLVPLWPVSPTAGACLPEEDMAGACLRRLEYAHPGLTEWWIGRGDGVQQGWTVERRPLGDGAMLFEVSVEGALDLAAWDEGALLVDGGGLEWSVGGLRAWDATGRDLRVWLESSEGGFRVRVDDRGARYPIEVDPVYESAAWETDGGYGVGAGFGDAVAIVGDINGDGFDDAAVSSTQHMGAVGAVHIYFGSAEGIDWEADQTLRGLSVGEAFGSSLAPAGDVNGDGYADLIVAAGAYLGYTGRVDVFHGGPAGLEESPSATYTGAALGDAFGQSLAGAGDLNGDGYDDIAIGAPDASSSSGAVSVFYGSSTGLGGSADLELLGSSAERLGADVAILGDTNGDGYDDLAVGAPYADSETGRVSVFTGSAAGLSSSPDLSLEGEGAGHRLGNGVAAAGDVNGDGHADLVVTVFEHDDGWGRMYVYHGSDYGLSLTPDTTAMGLDESIYERQVAGIGDVNADGYDDIVLAALYADSSSGEAGIFHGGPSGIDSTPTETLDPDDKYSAITFRGEFGDSFHGRGDLDGDGYGDVLVGAPRSYYTLGLAYLYTGGADGLDSTRFRSLVGEDTEERYGSVVVGLGDVDADGFDDIAVASPLAYWESGRVYVFHGSADGPEETARSIITGSTLFAELGSALAPAGDVNGDGFADLIAGASPYDSTSGMFQIHHGSAAGMETSPAFSASGSRYAALGTAVAGVGDVDGDGYDDVAVGAPSRASETGSVNVYYGSAAGVDGASVSTLSGTSAGEGFGAALAGASDLDGDGYAEVVVGAPSWSGGAGRVLVFHGSALGPGASPSSTLEGAGGRAGYGGSLAGLGDVNGDGYEDLIVATAESLSRLLGLWAEVYLGSATGLSSSPATTLEADLSAATVWGTSVAGLGDVNGDGLADLAIGCGIRTGGRTAGCVYVHHGSAAGVDSTHATLLTGGVNENFGASIAGAGDVNGDGLADLVVGASFAHTRTGSASLYLGVEGPTPEDPGDTGDTGDTGLADGGGSDGGGGDTGEPGDGGADGGGADGGGADGGGGDTGEPGDGGGTAGDGGDTGEPWDGGGADGGGADGGGGDGGGADGGRGDTGGPGDGGGTAGDGGGTALTPEEKSGSGCGGCSGAPGAPFALALPMVLLALRGRRRTQA